MKPDNSPDVTDNPPRSTAVQCSALLCATHDFKEEYYGWRCVRCGQFYPNTCPLENWLNNEPYDHDRH